MKSVKRISVFLVIVSAFFGLFMKVDQHRDYIVQSKIIDNAFKLDSYSGYILIPRFGIKRLIKSGTDDSVLDSGYVGIYEFSGDLSSNDLIILAGHNIPNVFSKLHDISIGDIVFVNNGSDRKFIVYDKKIVSESDFSYFYNRNNELMLITCDKKGYRLLVFLREDLWVF